MSDPLATVRFDDAEALWETRSGLKVEIYGEVYWIPKSHIHADSEVYRYRDGEDNTGALIVSEWIARQKGLV